MLKQKKIEFLVSKFRKKLEEIAENMEEGSEDFYQEFEQAEELIFNSQKDIILGVVLLNLLISMLFKVGLKKLA